MLIKKTRAISIIAPIIKNRGKPIMANSIAAAPRVFFAHDPNGSKGCKRRPLLKWAENTPPPQNTILIPNEY
jgi:hypothetical protein